MSIIDDSRCGLSDVSFHITSPIGGLSQSSLGVDPCFVFAVTLVFFPKFMCGNVGCNWSLVLKIQPVILGIKSSQVKHLYKAPKWPVDSKRVAVPTSNAVGRDTS